MTLVNNYKIVVEIEFDILANSYGQVVTEVEKLVEPALKLPETGSLYPLIVHSIKLNAIEAVR